jgi:hypothetical protein
LPSNRVEAVSLRADLHLHTHASDGQLTPIELVRLARTKQLDALAITDHDTTDGIPAAQAAANGAPLIIPGIELGTEAGGHDVDVLGYYLNVEHPGLQARLAGFRDDRLTRGQRIVERLATLRKSIAWERVLAIASGGAVGRVHVARALVEAGYVNTISEAFGKYLHRGCPAYVARERMSPAEAIQLLHAAGGVAVLAHPGLVTDYAALIERLVPAGLDGVEVMHPRNTENVRHNLRALAKKHDLLITGGSDFHHPGVDDLGGCTPSPDCVYRLRERARRYQPF